MRTADQYAAVLVTQYLAPQARRLGVGLSWVNPAGIAWLADLLADGFIDMKTARASVSYQLEEAAGLAALFQGISDRAGRIPATPKGDDGQRSAGA